MKKLLLTFICLLITVAYATAAGGGAVVFDVGACPDTHANYWNTATKEVFYNTNPKTATSMSIGDITVSWTAGMFADAGGYWTTGNTGTLKFTPANGKKITSVGILLHSTSVVTFTMNQDGSQSTVSAGDANIRLWTATTPSSDPLDMNISNWGDEYIDEIYVSYEDAGGDTPEPTYKNVAVDFRVSEGCCIPSEYTWDPTPTIQSFRSQNPVYTTSMTMEDITASWQSGLFAGGGDSDWEFASTGKTLTFTPANGAKIDKIGFGFHYGEYMNAFNCSADKAGTSAIQNKQWIYTLTDPSADPVTVTINGYDTGYGQYVEYIYVSYLVESSEPEPEPDPNDPANWTLPDNYNFNGKYCAWVYGDKNVVTEVTYTLGEEPFVAPKRFVNPDYASGNMFTFKTQDSQAVTVVSSLKGELTINSLVGTSVFTCAPSGSDVNNPAAVVLTINVQRPAAAVEVPELFVQDGPGNLVAFGSGFPVSPSNTIELKSTTEGVIYRYTLDGTDPTTSASAVNNDKIKFTADDLDKTFTLKAVALKDEDVSDVVEYTVTIHNWYLVDNNFVNFADNTYFVIASRQSNLGYAVGQTPSANGFTLADFTITGTTGVPSDSQKLPAIFKKNGNFFEFITKDPGVNRFLAHDTSALTSFANPTGNCTVSVGENGQFTLGSRFVQYSTNPYDFELAALGAAADANTAKLYAWTAKPDYKLSFFLDNKSYESLGDVPYRVDLGKKLTVIFPEGFNPQYKGEPVANNTLEIEFDAPGQQNVEFSWTNSAGEKQNLLKTFNVMSWNLSWTPEGEPETELTGDSGNIWVGSPVNITAPEGTDHIIYNAAGTSESVASGQTMKLIFRNAGTFAYTFKAVDDKDAVFATLEYTFNVSKEDVTSDTQMIDFTANDYGFKVNDGNTSIVGGNLNAGCKDTGTAAEIFLPGGENFAALTEVDGKQMLKLGDNSAVRLGLESGLQFVSITVNGTNLQNIKVSGPTGDNGLGEFREVGNLTVNADGTSATWIYSPTFEYELHTIQIWNNPAAESGISTLAAGDPAYISSINFTTATSTGVNAVNVDDTVDLWFDLQGNAVDADALAPGLYIHISNGHAVKVLVK